MPCATRLRSLLQYPPATFGFYPSGCVDGVGYSWAPCDPAALPQNANWSSNSLSPGASRGCAFKCATLTLPWNGGASCLPCFRYAVGQTAPCVPGQSVRACGSASGYAACQPCTGTLPGPLQAWTSDAPYFAQCRADCEAGVSFRAPALLLPGGNAVNASATAGGNAQTCLPCSRVTCDVLGTRYVPCTPTSNARCLACSTAPPAREEFVAPGACTTRCMAGFYRSPLGDCLACVPVSPCGRGQYASSTCAEPSDRLAAPVCLPCAAVFAPPLTEWRGQACERQCVAGAVSMATDVPRASPAYNGTLALLGGCVLCTPSLCGTGMLGACGASGLTCAACPSFEGAVYDPALAGLGSCSAMLVQPSETPAPAAAAAPPVAPAVAAGGYARPWLQYPVRALPHS